MPIFDFKCSNCKTIKEDVYIHSITSSEFIICPSCNIEMTRLFPKNTHVVIDGAMDSRPIGAVIKEKNNALKKKHAGYSHEGQNLRDKVNSQVQAMRDSGKI